MEKISDNELISALNDLDNDIAEAEANNTPAVQENETDLIDELAEKVIKNFGEVNSRSEDIFELFYTRLAADKDRSDASKQALIESIRLKNENTANIVNLINAKAKLMQAMNNNNNNKTGVYVAVQSGKEAGIDLSSLS